MAARSKAPPIGVATSGTFTEDTLSTIAGSSSLSSTGITTLSGSNTYTGATTVAGGTLTLNGTLSASAVSVGAAGTFTEALEAS